MCKCSIRNNADQFPSGIADRIDNHLPPAAFKRIVIDAIFICGCFHAVFTGKAFTDLCLLLVVDHTAVAVTQIVILSVFGCVDFLHHA